MRITRAIMVYVACCVSAIAQVEPPAESLTEQALFQRIAVADLPFVSNEVTTFKTKAEQLTLDQRRATLLAYRAYVDDNLTGDERRHGYKMLMYLFPLQESLPYGERELWKNPDFADRFQYLGLFDAGALYPPELNAEDRRYLCDKVLEYMEDLKNDRGLYQDPHNELHRKLLNIIRVSGDEGVTAILTINRHGAFADVLGDIGTKRAFEELYRIYDETQTMDNRLSVAKALAGRWGQVENQAMRKKVIQLLDETLDSKDARYRKMAIGIVARTEDERFLPKLQEMAARDPYALKVVREFENRRRPGYAEHKFKYERIDYAQRQIDQATKNINAGILVERNQVSLKQAQEDLAYWTQALEEALAP